MILQRATAFMASHARNVERRLFEAAFFELDPAIAVIAMHGYLNADGGYGHALEPDVRTSASQPLFVHFALSGLREVGRVVPTVQTGMCNFLDAVSNEGGAIPYLLPSAMEDARAGHWNGDFALAPSLHATAGVTAGLHALGVEHAWVDRATTWCLEQVAGTPTYSGHTLLNVLDLLHHCPQDTTDLWKRATGQLFEGDHVKLEPHATSYGLTPLQFAPTPTSALRAFFTDDVIASHLDALAAQQQDDGGWPLSWNPPAGAATDEWRGKLTLEAARTLQAYGRID